MAQIDYSPVQQALCRVRELSADEEARRLAFVRERAERDERSAMRGAREAGREEGREAGREEGRREGKLEGQAALLERLLAHRFGPLSERVQARLHSATAEDLARWADRILDAPHMESVFSVG